MLRSLRVLAPSQLRASRTHLSAPHASALAQADVWIAPNPVVPGTSVVRVVVLPPASVSAATLAGNGQAAAHRVVVWMRRLQEAALMIQSQPVIS